MITAEPRYDTMIAAEPCYNSWVMLQFCLLDVNGKTIHVVQKLPPVTTSSTSTTSSSTDPVPSRTRDSEESGRSGRRIFLGSYALAPDGTVRLSLVQLRYRVYIYCIANVCHFSLWVCHATISVVHSHLYHSSTWLLLHNLLRSPSCAPRMPRTSYPSRCAPHRKHFLDWKHIWLRARCTPLAILPAADHIPHCCLGLEVSPGPCTGLPLRSLLSHPWHQQNGGTLCRFCPYFHMAGLHWHFDCFPWFFLTVYFSLKTVLF